MHTTTSNSGMLTFVGLLTLTCSLVNLLCGMNWPWLWVLAPAWITLLSVPVLFVIVGLRYSYVKVRKNRAARRKSPDGAMSVAG